MLQDLNIKVIGHYWNMNNAVCFRIYFLLVILEICHPKKQNKNHVDSLEASTVTYLAI